MKIRVTHLDHAPTRVEIGPLRFWWRGLRTETEWMLHRIPDDVRYTVKLIRSAWSGVAEQPIVFKEYYSGGPDDYSWEPVTLELLNTDPWYPGDPYYWCVEFNNGRHMPAPFLNHQFERIGPLQKTTYLLLERLGVFDQAMAAFTITSKVWYGEWRLACDPEGALYVVASGHEEVAR